VKRKLDTRTLGVLVAVLLLVVAAAGYFLVVGPKKSAAERLDTEIATATADLVAARAAAEAMDDTQPITVADIFRLAKAMPSKPDMPGILLELARIADETGIRFTSISPQTSTTAGVYQLVPIAVVFEGSFYALSDLLFRIRTLVSVRRGELHAAGRLFSVESVGFAEAESGFPNLTASLTLNAYVYGTSTPANEVPPPAETTPPPAEGAEVPPADGEVAAAGATG
jgi:Pilus assembly protein, PilO